MILPWRSVRIGNGPFITTSLTANESDALRDLAQDESVVEVGSAYGYSTIVMAEVAQQVWSIDPHMGYGSVFNSLPLMRDNLKSYGVEDKVHVIYGDDAYGALAHFHALGNQYGLVFIDGDHREEAVRADVTLAMNMAKRVACHDYGEDTCPDVRKVLDSLGVEPARIVDTLWIWERP